jgi:uncharacterized protein YcaQ
MDSKADRKNRILIVHNLHFEKVKLTKQKIAAIKAAIRNFARFNHCEKVEVRKTNNKEFLSIG